jgi:hypothetical protein
MTRRLIGGMLATIAAFVLIARADDPTRKESGDKIDPKAVSDAARDEQDRMRRQFTEFEGALLRLKQRLQASSRPEDQQKAKVLDDALKAVAKEGIDTRFTKLVQLVADTKTFDDLTKLKEAIDYNHKLMEDLKHIVEILLTDNRDALLREEIARLMADLRRLNNMRDDQLRARTLTDRGANKDRIARDQKSITDDMRAFEKGQPKPADNKEQQVAKADFKNEGKTKGRVAEGKEDTKDAKVGDKAQDAKQGDPKDNKGDGKQADQKDGKGDAKSGDPKQGDPKDGKGDGKEGDAKSGDPKDGKGDGKQGDAKSGDPKQAQAKTGEPKKGDAKSGDPKDGKPGDPKADGKQGDGKPGDSKSASKGKGDGKGEGKPGEGKGGQAGQSSQAKSQSGQSGQGQSGQGKGDSKPQQAQKQQPPKDDQGSTAPIRKKIGEGAQNSEKAENQIKVPNNEKATEEQTEVLKKIDEARRKLEDLLRQLRQEEIERILAALQMRCERMLQMQIEVRDGTVKIFKEVEGHDTKKPDRADQQAANRLSDREEEIIREASAAIQILQAEGSSVAFPEVFDDLRGEMIKVSRRLRTTDVSLFTQRIENDIIAGLKEMIESLKRARQDNQNPKPPSQGGGGGQQAQKLVELLQELKLIRFHQIRVNKRTEDYAREYPGEQAPSKAGTPEEREKVENLNKEMKDLGESQRKIERMTDKLRKNLQQQ